jgi:hypothetical protein
MHFKFFTTLRSPEISPVYHHINSNWIKFEGDTNSTLL